MSESISFAKAGPGKGYHIFSTRQWRNSFSKMRSVYHYARSLVVTPRPWRMPVCRVRRHQWSQSHWYCVFTWCGNGVVFCRHLPRLQKTAEKNTTLLQRVNTLLQRIRCPRIREAKRTWVPCNPFPECMAVLSFPWQLSTSGSRCLPGQLALEMNFNASNRITQRKTSFSYCDLSLKATCHLCWHAYLISTCTLYGTTISEHLPFLL